MHRDIRKAAARLRLGVFAAIGVMIVVYVMARLSLQIGGIRVVSPAHGAPGTIGLILTDASMLMLLSALLQLARMLALLGAGQLFSVAVIHRFRAFAFWLMSMAVLRFLMPFLAELMRSAPYRSYHFAFLLDLRELLTLGITLFLFLLARLLEQARAIEDEMREIV